MRVLVLGSGGREYAFALMAKQSPAATEVLVAPGNGGTASLAENVAINPSDFHQVKDLVKDRSVDLVIVGPEAPLVEGIVDFFRNDPELSQVAILGPSKEAAQLEGSKAYAKAFMKRHNIPTAAYAEFNSDTYEEALSFVKSKGAPIVVKADGLAAGKGVRVCMTEAEAEEALHDILREDQFGAAGSSVVIEEFLDGIELSVFALTDGTHYTLLPTAKDYKRIGEGDAGLNTGGMGAVSPVPFAKGVFMQKVIDKIVEPTINGLHTEKLDYRGFVYFGLINVKGEPYVIEYNARMGDPETEVVLPRVKEDLLPVLQESANGNLVTKSLEEDERAGCTVVMVSGGYPGSYEKGKRITGLDLAHDNSIVYHAGTALGNDGVMTSGGRVLAITSLAPSLKEALAASYQTIGSIDFEGAYYRKDIGFDIT